MTLEFNSASDLFAHYARLKSKFYPKTETVRIEPPPLEVPPPVHVVFLPETPSTPPSPAMMLADNLPEGETVKIIAMLQRLRALDPRPNVQFIQRMVATAYCVKQDDLAGKSRRGDLIHPRHLAIFLAREITKLSCNMIGRHFSDRDHTTILHACRKFEHILELPWASDPISLELSETSILLPMQPSSHSSNTSGTSDSASPAPVMAV